MTEDVMDPANFLRAQGNMMKYKKEQIARMKQEERFRKEHTFEPDTKLTKNKVIPKHPKSRANHLPNQSDTNPMRTSVSSINLDGIAKKKNEPKASVDYGQDPFDQEKKPRHAELYKQRKRQIDKQDKTKEDYEFERHGQECSFAPKLISNPKYLKSKPASRQKIDSQQTSKMTDQQNESQNDTFGTSKKSIPVTAKQRQEQFERKQLERMKKAREEKMRKNAMFERGEPAAQKQLI